MRRCRSLSPWAVDIQYRAPSRQRAREFEYHRVPHLTLAVSENAAAYPTLDRGNAFVLLCSGSHLSPVAAASVSPSTDTPEVVHGSSCFVEYGTSATRRPEKYCILPLCCRRVCPRSLTCIMMHEPNHMLLLLVFRPAFCLGPSAPFSVCNQGQEDTVAVGKGMVDVANRCARRSTGGLFDLIPAPGLSSVRVGLLDDMLAPQRAAPYPPGHCTFLGSKNPIAGAVTLRAPLGPLFPHRWAFM